MIFIKKKLEWEIDEEFTLLEGIIIYLKKIIHYL
jgi:hypothetical protein